MGIIKARLPPSRSKSRTRAHSPKPPFYEISNQKGCRNTNPHWSPPSWLLSLEERETQQYTFHMYCSAPPICTAVRLPFLVQYASHLYRHIRNVHQEMFWKNQQRSMELVPALASCDFYWSCTCGAEGEDTCVGAIDDLLWHEVTVVSLCALEPAKSPEEPREGDEGREEEDKEEEEEEEENPEEE